MRKRFLFGALGLFLLLPGWGGDEEAEGWLITQLTVCRSGVSSDPRVSPDGKQAFFISNCDLVGRNSDQSSELFKWDRGKLIQLTDVQGCSIIDLALSPDGKQAAFVSNCQFGDKNPGRSPELMVFSESGELKVLTESFGHPSRRPSWSGDGRMIAFESSANLTGENFDYSNEIFLLDLAASPVEFKQLSRTKFPGGCEHPNLVTRSVICRCNDDLPGTERRGRNPDLTVIMDGRTVGGNPDRNFELFNLQLAGKPRQLTYTELCENGPPTISPQGRLIAFTSDCSFSAEPAGNRVTELYFLSEEIIRPFPGFAFDGVALAWSDNGRRLSFSSTMNLDQKNRERNPELFVIDLPRALPEDLPGVFKNSSPPRLIKPLTSFTYAASGAPDLNQDGTVIVFVSNANLKNQNPDGSPEIFMAREFKKQPEPEEPIPDESDAED